MPLDLAPACTIRFSTVAPRYVRKRKDCTVVSPRPTRLLANRRQQIWKSLVGPVSAPYSSGPSVPDASDLSLPDTESKQVEKSAGQVLGAPLWGPRSSGLTPILTPTPVNVGELPRTLDRQNGRFQACSCTSMNVAERTAAGSKTAGCRCDSCPTCP